MIDFMLFRGFDLSQTNRRTDICTSRVAFATEKLLGLAVHLDYSIRSLTLH